MTRRSKRIAKKINSLKEFMRQEYGIGSEVQNSLGFWLALQARGQIAAHATYSHKEFLSVLDDQHTKMVQKKNSARKYKPLVAKSKKQKRSIFKKPDKKSPPFSGFYASWEWKKARFEILKKYGAVCMLCGSVEKIVVDHIKPKTKFPELALDLNNLQVLCNDCNMGKSNNDYTDFRPKPATVTTLKIAGGLDDN